MLYFSFNAFIFLLNCIFTYAAFIPSGRLSHSSILNDRKLYFSGGMKFVNGTYNAYTNEFFYLDVSKPFTITDNISIPWVDLTYTGGPQKLDATACIGGKNNDMVFIFGDYPNNQPFVSQFDTSKQQWIDIASVGSVPTNRYSISCAGFNNGSIAIFSGYNITNDLWIFNTLRLTWSLSNATNAPLSRYSYQAITLPDDNILYIGGFSNITNSYMPMNNNTSGSTPPSRNSFSAILTPDGRIVIFGGHNSNTTFGDLWILDTTIYQWSVGSILNPIVDLTLREHTATLVNNYMFVGFGIFSNSSVSSKIFMLDVSQKDSYKWVTKFVPNSTDQATTIIPSPQNIGLVIGVTICGIILLAVFIAAMILLLKFVDYVQ
ncbi:17055_t:CDS:2 [Cetraspora pellucida]|uniref:17055_t:CDS:1 n=1 Tax=Cetraspora pellucida TaxID=1433469 RepID=A0A9N9CVG6_9GLOM|nr:17055_t:CDS:2 [Cetraspora pellucida]